MHALRIVIALEGLSQDVRYGLRSLARQRGLTAALIAGRFLSHLLYGVRPADLWSFLAVSLLLILVSLVASYLPARRATRIDPIEALRQD